MKHLVILDKPPPTQAKPGCASRRAGARGGGGVGVAFLSTHPAQCGILRAERGKIRLCGVVLELNNEWGWPGDA